MTPELITALSAAIVAVLGAVAGLVKAVQAGRSASSAHARLDELAGKQQGSGSSGVPPGVA